MKILVGQLTGRREGRGSARPPGRWARWRPRSTLPPGTRLGEPPHFEFDLCRSGEDVCLEGKMTGAIELQCSRCLERYRHGLRDEYRLRIEPAGDRQPPDPEGVRALQQHGLYLSDDLELAWFRGAEFEIDAFLAERVAQVMPMKPLCREECDGLCPHCGVKRSEESCECHDPKPNTPFAALAALVGGSEGEP